MLFEARRVAKGAPQDEISRAKVYCIHIAKLMSSLSDLPLTYLSFFSFNFIPPRSPTLPPPSRPPPPPHLTKAHCTVQVYSKVVSDIACVGLEVPDSVLQSHGAASASQLDPDAQSLARVNSTASPPLTPLM